MLNNNFAIDINKDDPLVSIIIASFNSGVELENTIKDVLAQNYKKWGIVIIDGGSTDITLEIIEKYKKYISYFISEEDMGIYYAMNKGILASRGEILHFLNAGDFYFNNDILRIIVDKFRETKQISIIYGLTECFSADKTIRYISGSFKKKGFFLGGMPTSHQSIFYNKKLFDLLGKYDTDFKIASDLEFFLRLKKYSKKFKIRECFLNIPLAKFNLSGFSDSNQKSTLEELKNVSLRYYNKNIVNIYFTYRRIKYILVKILTEMGLNKLYRRLKYNFFYKLKK